MTISVRAAFAAVSLLAAGAAHGETVKPAAQTDPVMVNDPAYMATFTQQYRDAFGEGAIPAKYKQLSGITLSVVVKCDDCVKSHVQSAIKLGARRAEIVEALRIGLLTGGSAGLPTMEAAYAAMDEAKLPNDIRPMSN
jgi:AhpD family alkylhydroperoxidase